MENEKQTKLQLKTPEHQQDPTGKAYWKETKIWNASLEPNWSKQAKLSDVSYEVKEEWRKKAELEDERKLWENREECAKSRFVSNMAQMLMQGRSPENLSLRMRAVPDCTWLLGGISEEV